MENTHLKTDFKAAQSPWFSGKDITWEDKTALYAFPDPEKGITEGQTLPHDLFRVSDFIPLISHEILLLQMPRTSENLSSRIGLCFYDEKKLLIRNRGLSIYYGRKAEDPPAKIAKVYIPKNACYFRTSYWRDGSLLSPFPAPFAYAFTDYPDTLRPFTHTLPTCEEMANVIKRSRQMTDIVWEPLVDIPRYCLADGDYSGQSETHFLDWCKPGHQYIGIPYSGSGEPDRNTKKINPETFAGKWGYYKFHVGIDIDFETFVTACRYPDSIFGERAHQSAPDFDSSPYGTYCSALVGYALGYRQPLPKVIEFCSSPDFNPVHAHLPEVSPEDLQLCDILINGAFHVAIITDLIRDGSGKVTEIEVSEATTVGNKNSELLGGTLGGFSRRKLWTVSDCYHWFQNYSLYRKISFQGVSYRKSPYVDIGNEAKSSPKIDLPLIPYLGNRARYKRGHIVNDRILIGVRGFSQLVIEKDGAPFRVLAIGDQNYVSGAFSEPGSYSAYLSDGEKRSESCFWTVEE